MGTSGWSCRHCVKRQTEATRNESGENQKKTIRDAIDHQTKRGKNNSHSNDNRWTNCLTSIVPADCLVESAFHTSR